MRKIKIAQFGEGNFLRTFVDSYFTTLNKEGHGPYSVTIIKPIKYGSLDVFKERNCKYNIVLRGVADNGPIEEVRPIDVVEDVIDPFLELDKYYSLSEDDDLRIIVSNTTEAGIVFKDTDEFDADFAEISYPAKLTKFLLHRFNKGKKGLYILPVELIDDNGRALKEAVSKYIDLWNLGGKFKEWNDENNVYCSTLVDRIVSGHPKDEKTKNHLTSLIGHEDPLVSVGEPFGLWVVEKKGDVDGLIIKGTHDIDVVISDDVKKYKKRKVRILNGSHTNLVPLGILMGKQTVYDCMNDEKLRKFMLDTMINEILPFVSDDYDDNLKFSMDVVKRFSNPFLNHQLVSIALNSFSKWKERVLPSVLDYYGRYGELPINMAKGFAGLLALYSKSRNIDGRHVVSINGKEIELKDNESILSRFEQGERYESIMRDKDLWGMDLSSLKGFENKIGEYIKSLNDGEDIL